MITIIRADEVYVSEYDWLTSRFLFSFADYYNPSNMSWGLMRVFNHDKISGYSGFAPHSHKEMEIVTIMNSGTLTHSDSMGNVRSISTGYVQRMTVGTGVTHSEMNNGAEEVSLYQLWFTPRTNLSEPSYEEKRFEINHGLTLLVSPDGVDGSVSIGCDVKIYRGRYIKGEAISLPVSISDHVLVYISSGSAIVNNTPTLSALDQARVMGEEMINFVFEDVSEMIVVVA